MDDWTILVVDDSPIDRAVVAGFLQARNRQIVQAANGTEALEMIERELPTLVITDLQMPEMNGLELVSTIRRHYPHIPCILITSQGSEELATEAIRRGAASYVPKRSLASLLYRTVDQVMSATRKDSSEQVLERFQVRREYEYCIRNDINLIAPLVTRMQESVCRMFVIDEMDLVQIGIALSEALRNAIDHGNLELDSALRCNGDGEYERLGEFRRVRKPWSQRRVHITVVETPNEVRFTIRDEGPGFDRTLLTYDPTAPENLTRPCGRGLFLIREFMDEVLYNAAGNEITMIRRSGHPHRRRADDESSEESETIASHSLGAGWQ